MSGSLRSCASCGRTAKPAGGAFLGFLYPGESMCSGCGRRCLHCTCAPARPAAIPVLHGGFRGDAWAIKRMLNGWAPEAVATAAGVSRRTAQRWRAEIAGLRDIEMEGYVATFAIRHSKAPLQLTTWTAKR